MHCHNRKLMIVARASLEARLRSGKYRLMRDFAADWRRWSRAERAGACIAALASAAVPLSALLLSLQPIR